MRIFTRTLFGGDNEPTWAASTKKVIPIPQDRYIAGIDIRGTATYDGAAGAAKAADGVLNLISRINLLINGNPVRSWAPKRRWYQVPLDLGLVPEFKDVTTAVANGKTAAFSMPIPFRLDPKNLLDISALLPAPYLSSVDLEVEFGAANAFGANQTIQSGKVQLTLHERVLSTAEELAAYGKSGDAVAGEGSRLMEILENEVTKKVDAAYNDYQFAADLPTGDILRRQFLFAHLNGARDDTLVTKLRVRDETGSGRNILGEEGWEASQVRDLNEYGPPKALEGDRYLTGLTVLDYTDVGPLGLNQRGRRKGDVKFQANTIAPVGTTEIVFLNELIAPVGAGSK